MKYTVYVSWKMVGLYEIEADSLDNAAAQAYAKADLPDVGEYSNSSFEIDHVWSEKDGSILYQAAYDPTLPKSNVKLTKPFTN